jgi:catechol 2,3-dioxygenase-like lactoylglutathione lyase family enzyme
MPFLRHLALRCRDMERSRRFYEQGIGWKFVGYRPSGQSLDLSDGVNNITLLQHPAGPARTALPEGEEFIHFGVIVEDLGAVWRRLAELGAEFSKENVKDRNPIDPHGPPAVSFKVLDPDGNVVDVTGNRSEWRGVWLPAEA